MGWVVFFRRLQETLKEGLPCRYILAILAFWGFIFNYALRININIALVAMVNYTAIHHVDAGAAHAAECGGTGPSSQGLVLRNLSDHDHFSTDLDWGFENSSSSSDHPFMASSVPAKARQEDGEFAWDEYTQSLIVGSFFWGYILTQLPGGRIGEVCGVKRVFGLSMVASGIITILTPFIARLGAKPMIASRALMGLFMGVSFPAMHAMLARWAPPHERSRLSTFVYSGVQVGTVIAMPLSAVLIETFHWEAVFYFLGAASLVWCVFWMVFAHDSPAAHPKISPKEQKFIEDAIGTGKCDDGDVIPVPWREVVTSKPFWAIFWAEFGTSYGFWLLISEIPSYLKTMLGYDLKANGFLSALLYLCMWLFAMALSNANDYMRKRKVASATLTRKIANSLSHFGTAICLVGLIYAGCSEFWSLTFLILAVTFQGGQFPGVLTNHIDLAPNFAGTLFGITNGMSSIPAFIAPLTSGLIMEGEQTLANWAKVFWLTIGVYVVTNIVYIAWGSSEEAEWNRPKVKPPSKSIHFRNPAYQPVASIDPEKQLNIDEVLPNDESSSGSTPDEECPLTVTLTPIDTTIATMNGTVCV